MNQTIRNAVTALLVTLSLSAYELPPSSWAAASAWDAGGGANTNWGTATNWNPDGSPSGNDATFNTAGLAAAGDTSVVDASTTINSLVFDYTNSLQQQIRIANGQTLTINGAAAAVKYTNSTGAGASFLVTAALRLGVTNEYVASSGATASLGTTTAKVTGAGGVLVVNSSANDMFVGGVSDAGASEPVRLAALGKLDLSGLGTFTANVTNLRIGTTPDSPGKFQGNGELDLAGNSTVTASLLSVGAEGGDPGTGNKGVLLLGTSNALNIDTIEIGDAKNSGGTLSFAAGLTGASATIRAKNGTGRANLDVGYMTNVGVPREPEGTVDLSGGSVDALLGALRIGQGQRPGVSQNFTGGGLPTGTFVFASGTVDATSVTLGVGGNGKLVIGGGTLKTATLTMGGNTGGGAGNANGSANLFLSNGTVAATSIVPGSGTATARNFNWTSGTIQNLSGGNLTIDSAIPLTLLSAATHTFAVDASQTSTVNAAISGTAGTGGITKSGAGRLVLSATETYTGSTLVNAGTLAVTGSLANNGSSKVFLTTDPTAAFVSAATLDRTIPANSTYTGYGASGLGGLGSTADLRAGSNTTASVKSVTMQWGASDAGHKAGDILNLTGMTLAGATSHTTDVFALQMTYNEAVFGPQEASLATAGQIHLEWLNGSSWVNAVLGNFGAGGTVVTDYQGSWTAFATANSITDANVANFLGSWGVDTSGNAVWAVLNHNSEFDVSGVPEPSTVLLLAFGGIMVWRKVRGQRR